MCVKRIVPRREYLSGPDVSDDVQEVVAHEDASLQKQEGETDAVPDDAGLIPRQVTIILICRLWNCTREERFQIKVTNE